MHGDPELLWISKTALSANTTSKSRPHFVRGKLGGLGDLLETPARSLRLIARNNSNDQGIRALGALDWSEAKSRIIF